MRASGPQAAGPAAQDAPLEKRSKGVAAATVRALLAEHVCGALVQSEIPAGCRAEVGSGDGHPGVTGPSASTSDSGHSATAQGVCGAGVRPLPQIFLRQASCVTPLCRAGGRGAEGLRSLKAREHSLTQFWARRGVRRVLPQKAAKPVVEPFARPR